MTLGNLEKLHSCYAIIYISPKTAALTHHLKQDFWQSQKQTKQTFCLFPNQQNKIELIFLVATTSFHLLDTI